MSTSATGLSLMSVLYKKIKALLSNVEVSPGGSRDGTLFLPELYPRRLRPGCGLLARPRHLRRPGLLLLLPVLDQLTDGEHLRILLCPVARQRGSKLQRSLRIAVARRVCPPDAATWSMPDSRSFRENLSTSRHEHHGPLTVKFPCAPPIRQVET